MGENGLLFILEGSKEEGKVTGMFQNTRKQFSAAFYILSFQGHSLCSETALFHTGLYLNTKALTFSLPSRSTIQIWARLNHPSKGRGIFIKFFLELTVLASPTMRHRNGIHFPIPGNIPYFVIVQKKAQLASKILGSSLRTTVTFALRSKPQHIY